MLLGPSTADNLIFFHQFQANLGKDKDPRDTEFLVGLKKSSWAEDPTCLYEENIASPAQIHYELCEI